MENKGTNTDYQKFVRVWDQKCEIVEIITGIIFFAWDSNSLFSIQGVFKSHLKKSWFDLSSSYINIFKMAQAPHHPWGGGDYNPLNSQNLLT